MAYRREVRAMIPTLGSSNCSQCGDADQTTLALRSSRGSARRRNPERYRATTLAGVSGITGNVTYEARPDE